MAWNVSRAVREAGTYEVSFQSTGGAHQLDVEWVALLAGGKELARDTHSGGTGVNAKDNTYCLTIDTPAAVVVLKASVRSDDGKKSHGTIYIRRVK